MERFYVLHADGAVGQPDFREWVAWHANSYERHRCIARTSVKFGTVVTIFLGVNMALEENERPVLFETRVVGGWLDSQWQRYSTLNEARAGHEAWVAKVHALEEQNELPPPDCSVW
jgi:hypothetical protein